MKVTSSNILRFLRYVRPYRWTVALSALVGVVQNNLPVFFPWILKDVIDNLLAAKPSLTGLSFNQLMGLAVALFALYALITSYRTYISYRLAHEIIFDVRKDLFSTQHLPIDFFQKHRTGVIISRLITDVNNAQNFINIAGANLFMDLTVIASITFALFYMNWQGPSSPTLPCPCTSCSRNGSAGACGKKPGKPAGAWTSWKATSTRRSPGLPK